MYDVIRAQHGLTIWKRVNNELLFVAERNDGRKADGEEISKKELSAISAIMTGLQKVNLESDAPALITALLEAAVAPRNADLVLSQGLIRDINAFLLLHKA